MRTLVALALLVGCVKPGDVPCDDGRICPSGYVCDDVHALCVTNEQATACNGAADFTACDAVEMGSCYSDVCLPGGCGNGQKDPEEMCDDGNNIPGDGCSAECGSTELCRNTVVDLINNEECDDGNEASHDGCSSNCRKESPAWVDHANFYGRRDGAMAYDSIRARVVLAGGALSRIIREDTHEWDGIRWRSRPYLVSPGGREDARMAFDANRGVTVLFGGESAGAERNDTWEWNGAEWSLREPVGDVPRPRFAHALAYDEVSKRVILFGGTVQDADLGDTWAWDGTRWTQLMVSGPAARSSHAMAFDPVRNSLLMYGGITSADALLGDTWEFANGTWTQRATAGAAPGDQPLLAFDPVSQKMLMTAQDNSTTTWLWNGTAWMPDASSPATLSGGTIATDTQRGYIVALGTDGDTWIWSGTGWQRRPSEQIVVPGRNQSSLALDQARRRVLVFGGKVHDVNDQSNEAYFWDGTATQIVSASLPSKRMAAGLVHDKARDQFLLFGGVVGSSPSTTVFLGDFYSSNDGVTWTPRPTPPVGGRAGHLMVYDEARANTVVFGGQGASARQNDTWTWDGSAWLLKPVAGPPAVREYACGAYDPVRERVVMFGGTDNGNLADTWEWDGTTWTRLLPSAAPSARYGCSMAWDAGRKTLVLHGGNGASPETWTWDGTTWRLLATSRTAPPAQWGTMFTSVDGDGVTLHGGISDVHAFTQLYWLSSVPADHCGPADGDGDEKVGCLDGDCWTTCAPECPPGTSCTSTPSCGDGTCGPIEGCWTCPMDCGACPDL